MTIFEVSAPGFNLSSSPISKIFYKVSIGIKTNSLSTQRIRETWFEKRPLHPKVYECFEIILRFLKTPYAKFTKAHSMPFNFFHRTPYVFIYQSCISCKTHKDFPTKKYSNWTILQWRANNFYRILKIKQFLSNFRPWIASFATASNLFIHTAVGFFFSFSDAVARFLYTKSGKNCT
jgi:hypothetical protein